MPSLQELILGALSKGTEQGSDAARQQMGLDETQKNKLAMLAEQLTQAKKLKTEQGQETPVNVEGVSIGSNAAKSRQQAANESLAMRKEAQKMAQQEHQEKALTTFGQRMEKDALPQSLGAMSNLEQATASPTEGGILTNPNYQVKGGLKTGLARKIPFVGPAIAQGLESAGFNPKGTEQEAQAIQGLLNIDMKKFSGSAVTVAEEGRQLLEKGVSSGDPEAIKRGMAGMKRAMDMQSKNIQASTRPDVLAEYKQRGGAMGLEDLIKPRESAGPSTSGATQRQARIAELRKKLGQ